MAKEGQHFFQKNSIAPYMKTINIYYKILPTELGSIN